MLSLELKSKSPESAVVLIEIENNFSSPVMVSKDVVLLDGFTSDKFDVIDKSSNLSLPYLGRSVKYQPQKMQLQEHEKLVSELNLKDVYDLENCHEYLVIYKTTAIVEDSVLYLSGETNINTGECN